MSKVTQPLAIFSAITTIPSSIQARDIMALPFATKKRWTPKAPPGGFTNQLDLFSGAPIEEPDQTPAPFKEFHAGPRPPVQLDFGALDALPADDVNPTTAGKPPPEDAGRHGGPFETSEPELFIRGKQTYRANLNPDSPLGTVSSIEHVLRSFDRRAEAEQRDIENREKTLTEYRTQLDRPFEHEHRLKELLLKQAQLNASLDLDKSEAQSVAEVHELNEKTVSAGFAGKMAATHQRTTEIAL